MEASSLEVIIFFVGTILVARYLDWTPEPDSDEILEYYNNQDDDGCK